MSAKNKHVIRSLDGRWSVLEAGAERASRVFDRQSDALNYARHLARRQGVDLFVHRSDGTISKRDTFFKEAVAASSRR